MTIDRSARADRERVVEDLLAYMTLAERAGQLCLVPHGADGSAADERDLEERIRAGAVGGIAGALDARRIARFQRIAIEESRLGLPLFVGGDPAASLPGLMPDPLALAAGADAAAIEALYREAGRTMAAAGYNVALLGRVALADTLHAAHRDGAIASEPLLAAHCLAAAVRGLSHADGARLLPVLALGRSALSGRDGTGTILAAFLEASGGTGAVALDPVAHAEHRDALARLRAPGLFDGMILSEWTRLAILAGAEPQGAGFLAIDPARLVAAVADGRIAEALLNEAVRRVLSAKLGLGLFRSALDGAPPGPPLTTKEAAVAAALAVAGGSVTLIRDEPALLPLHREGESLLVVEPLAASGAHDTSGLAAALPALGIPVRYVSGLALRQDGRAATQLIDADRLAIGMACEAARRSRTVLVALETLGPAQRHLLEALRQVCERVLLVGNGSIPFDPLIGGRPLDAVLHAPLPPRLRGPAVAAMVTGARPPGGRLPAPLPDGESGPLPFGHGLGFGDIVIDAPRFEFGADELVASALLRNFGEDTGAARVLLFVRRVDGAEREPALRGWQSVELAPGASRRVDFVLGAAELASPDADGRLRPEPGIYAITFGRDAAHGQTAEVRLPEAIAAAMRGERGLRPRAAG